MKIDKRNVKDIVPLTAMQEGMLFHYLSEEEQIYKEHLVINIKGNLDEELVTKSWNQVVDAHDVLRGVFRWKNLDKPVQIILKEKQPVISFYRQDKMPRRTEEECNIAVTEEMKKRSLTLDDLTFYLCCCQYKDSGCIHLLFHHIILDGWSISIIIRHFLDIYQGSITGIKKDAERYGSFKDFVMAGKQSTEAEQKQYWQETFAGYQIKNSVRPLLKSKQKQTYEKIEQALPGGLYEEMVRFCKTYQVTMASLFYSAWGLMTGCYIYDKDIVFGTTISGRNSGIPDIENTVGLLINTVPLRMNPAADISAVEMVRAVQQNLLQRQPYEQTSLSAIANYAGIQAGELLKTIVVIENYPLTIAEPELSKDQMFTVSGFSMEEYTHYPLTVIVDAGNQYQVKLLYDTEAYEVFTLQSMLDSFIELLKNMIRTPDTKIQALNMITKADKEKIIQVFNDTITEYPRNENIVSLFKQSVERYPQKTAIVYQNKQLSYQELDRQSDMIAGQIMKADIQKEECVGLMCERGLEMIVSMLGVLKAQAVYVPISPEYPAERKEFILQEIKANILICNCGYVPAAPVTVIDLCDGIQDDHSEEYNIDTNSITPKQLAYLIYTSGSTGSPKGIMIEHQGVIRLVCNTNFVEISSNDRMLLTSPLEFDVSGFEIWGTLIHGATAYLLDKGKMLSPKLLHKFLSDNEISFMWMTTPLFNQMAQVEPKMFQKLRYLIIGGDALSPSHVARVRNCCSNLELVNGYGPTENTVFSTTFSIKQDYESRVPIGYPVANSSAYILDPYGKLAPIGALGELCTGLDGVARGYYDNPELTNEKFVKDIVYEGRRMYRTGDLARFMPDGTIDFFGRMDYQVKIRGFRIELTEIESVMNCFEGVSECAVIATDREEYDKQLIAYIQTESKIQIDDLKEYLKEQLPVYCLPSKIVLIDRMPFTVNGKINRKELKNLEVKDTKAAVGNITESAMEKKIKAIWENVLNIQITNMEMNFFEMGGTSLHMIQIADQLQTELKRDITVVDLYTHTTIRSLALYLGHNGEITKEDQPAGKAGDETEDSIAIIGMSGRFPGAKTIKRFYQNICEGRICISLFTKAELSDYVDANTLEDDSYVRAKGVLEDSEYFDAALFGYSDREAELMDPQLRLLHESVYHAFEDAGYLNSEMTAAGLFIGASPNFDWLLNIYSDIQDDTAIWEAGNLNFHSLAAPIAYKLNMQGPVMMNSTACSSSLVTVHMACRSLLAGECEIAAAGGVSVSLPLKNGYRYQEGMIKSPDGRCRPFQADSNGTVTGNGVGVVILKPLSKAIKDRDHIYAVIKGSAVNNDGSRKVGFTAPSKEGQCEVIRSAMQSAGINGDKVRYIETHGTGTPVGDAIELKALQETYGRILKGEIAIDSIKAGIGHLDCAAGIAGIMKTALCLEKGIIPPAVHKGSPENLLTDGTSFYLNTERKEWKKQNGVYQAGISSFGIGGTNVHMILQEPPVLEPSQLEVDKWHVFPFSANKQEALNQQLMQFARLFEQQDLPLQNVAYMLQTGRKNQRYRAAFVAETRQSLAKQLIHAAGQKPSLVKTEGIEKKAVVYLFPGQGKKYFGACKELYWDTGLYREVFDGCLARLEPRYQYLKDYLLGYAKENEDDERMNQTEYVQPVLFFLEYTLAKTLELLGVKPTAMIGHSLGEYAAAAVAGVFSFEEGFYLVESRARFMQKMEKGVMFSVVLGLKQLEKILGKKAIYDIAAVNAKNQTVISGSPTEMEKVRRILDEEEIAFVKLKVSHAFHSRMMEPMLPEFGEKLQQIEWQKPKIPYISNLTGEYISDHEATDWKYYQEHLRNCVCFEKGIKTLQTIADVMFIEVGAGEVLSRLVMQNSSNNQRVEAMSLLQGTEKQTNADSLFSQAFAQLWKAGYPVEFKSLYRGGVPDKLILPGYCFDKRKYWKYGTKTESKKQELLIYEPVWECVNRQDSFTVHQTDTKYLLAAEQNEYSEALASGIRYQGNLCSLLNINDMEVSPKLIADDGEINIIMLIPNMLTEQQATEQLLQISRLISKYQKFYHESKIYIMFAASGFERVYSTDAVNPYLAMIKGLVRTAADEYPNFLLGSLDIGRTNINMCTEVIMNGFAIFRQESAKSPALAYRGGEYSMVHYQLQTPKRVIEEHQALRYRGVYLITGGLGGIGLAVADYLASAYQAVLTLLTHSFFPERKDWEEWLLTHDRDNEISMKILHIQKLEQYGAVICIKQVSLTDEMEMKRLMGELKDKFSQLDGVIHAAGVGDQTLIDFLSADQMNRVFQPKVAGTVCMHKQLKASGLLESGFLVFFSSLASLIGGIGQAAYACANTFLDSYAEIIKSDGIQILSINWDTWKEVGMAAKAIKDVSQGSFLKDYGIQTTTGVEVLFEMIHAMPFQLSHRAIISCRKLFTSQYTQEQMLGLAETQSDRVYQPRPQQPSEYQEPETQEEIKLVKILEDFTGISPIGVHDNFFELGITSLDIIQINNRINKIYSKDESVVKLYHYSTCRQLAGYLSSGQTDDARTEQNKKQQEKLRGSRKKTAAILNKRRGKD